MKTLKKTAILLASFILAMAMTGASVFANSTEISGEAHFNGSEIESTFNSDEVVKAFKNLQPGDDITVAVKYQNDYSKTTDWYMANEVVKTLEKLDNAKITPKAEGDSGKKAENGGYTYSLIHTDQNGKDVVLFSNDEVGGDAKPANMEGLEQATNDLDDWFYLETLDKGKSGKITLSIKFDGETEVNDYMDTDGEVLMKFAVELTGSTTPGDNDKPKYKQENNVKTGDMFKLGLCLLLMLIGLIMLVLLLRRRRHEEGGEA